MNSFETKGNRLTLPWATANFPEDYLPYTATYSRNKDPYLVWDSGFDPANDGHYHHSSHTTATASIDSHSPASLNHYHMQSHNHLYPTCSASSASWPSSKKRKCCGLSCGCCALTLLALVIISALATVVGFSVYLAMITNLHKSSPITLNGSFKVESGDNFSMKLLNTTSTEFMRKANKYETIIKTAFETSSVSNAITKQEVYAFREGSLIVFFRLYLDRRKFDNSINSETARNDHKKNTLPFDGVFASKLLQKELREGISQLKITGTEQIVIDIKSIKVMNELDSMADNNVNQDIKTSGIASGSKALAPIKSTKDMTKLLSEKSESKSKVNTTVNITTVADKSPVMSSTLASITTNKTKTSIEAEPDLINQTSNTVSTNTTANEIPLISSTVSSINWTKNESSVSTNSSQSTNQSELNVFTSNKPNYTEIKWTTVPPKSEYRNPFLPAFTRRQSTVAAPVTTSSPSITNVRLTTRSRQRSTTTSTTTTSTTTTTTTPLPSVASSSPTTAQPSSSTKQPNDSSNILLKRTDIRDDGLKPPGLNFGQWKPVVPQQVKPQPKPLPPRPMPPPIQAGRPPLPIPNQMTPNLVPGLRPPQQILPQYMPNRPSLRIPMPFGKPMREVPRLLDDDGEQDIYTPGPVPIEIERHNTSIVHVTTVSMGMTSTPPSTSSPLRSSSIRSSRQSTTTADPSMVDGFIVPISSSKAGNFLIPDLRNNKSLDVVNENSRPFDASSTSAPQEVIPSSEGIHELSVGSPLIQFQKPSNKTSSETIETGIPNDSAQEESPSLAVSQPSNSLEPTLNSNLSLELPKTKSPFEYLSAINETLFSSTVSIESTSNATSSVMPPIISSTHKITAEVLTSTANPNRNVSTSIVMPDIEMIAGLPIGIDKSDQSIPQKLIRPLHSSEPAYGERLPKNIPPALLYQKYPTNDILSEGVVVNSEDIENEGLYDDEILSVPVNHSTTLDAINLFSLTTTTSHRMETTTAVSSCADNEFQCGSGECLSSRAHCNRRIECKDGSDEQNCTCAHYLKAERQFKKICDGVIDCYDSSDEIDCSYCKESYVCAQSHTCIDKSKVCNGDNDCPNGDDESECISLVPSQQTLDTTGQYLNSEGALYIRQKGEWAPLCLDDLNMANDLDSRRKRRSEDSPRVEDLGKAICRANSYADLESVQMVRLNDQNPKIFFKMEEKNDEISPSLSMWSTLFEKSECLSKRTTYVKCKDFECGVRPVTNGIRRRIVGGQSASQGSWPWQVALYREGEFQCGGVIIDSEWLLTAAHCFHATRDAYWTARFGILRRGTVFASPYEQLRRITHVLVHKDYVDKGFINDIALLKLDSPINYSKHVRPVCMPSESDDVSKWNRQLCTTVGWGKLFEHGRIFPDTLQEVKLPVISTEECRKRTLFLPLYKITDNMFCAGYDRGGRDACLGDSGGPLMCQKRNGKWFLLGVTSNGDGCGRAGRPGVYTKVAKYRDWIQNIITSDLEPELNRTCDGLRCPLGRCLKKEHICNGIMDCRDASDEQNCTEYRVKSFNSTET